MLKVVNLNKSFKQNRVLKDITFELEKGEVGVLLGKSGAGKTTILRCINDLERFDSGEIIIDNKTIKSSKDMAEIRGEIGMVFQNFNLFPHMTVLENIIESPVNIFKVDRSEAEKSAKELLKLVDLEDKLDAYPFELSGGQQQRVAIARSCALMPKVLCFDEPTSALDSDTIQRVVAIIKKLKDKGMTVLIITHDVAFADGVADKIISIKDGVVGDIKLKEEI
ncbi:amino acid ABC transporter ATP-binding protein [Metaclostridioides mangenotii]|uniref:Polar amino acid transport system ATP-binding protein n=1 Tax=Metaclostridioides mangenotii TaxID=1540 RepID=A0ABS4E7M1_9FIRM|nr:amino acid ABC transporter ATP-binding protein [Clostridioides mangenotii]MBP1853922.1 polar amino acid transport system ATP-binding protein [Clostridioides mangenotii]